MIYCELAQWSWNDIHTHCLHSVLVQDFVSGQACCVNQYHCESRYRRVGMQLVRDTGKTWYIVLYQNIMYVISLSNISIKTNFKQIRRVELKLTNLDSTLRETTCCTSCYITIICCKHTSAIWKRLDRNCHWKVIDRICIL